MEEKLYFISMDGRSGYYIDGFKVEESIPLPVLVAPGEAFSTEHITTENIISGMLKIIETEPDHDNIEYYRSFILTVKPDFESQMSSIAYEAELNGDFADAIAIYNLILTINPKSSDALLNLAISYDNYSDHSYSKGEEQRGDILKDRAAEHFKQLESSDEKNERIYYYLGRFYAENNNYARAIDYFGEFIKLTDDDEHKKEVVNYVNDLKILGLEDENYTNALFFYEAEKFEDGLKLIDNYLTTFQHSWHGHLLRGRLLTAIGNHKESLESLLRALEINRESSDICNLIGLNYMELGDFRNSEKHFFKALNFDPDNLSIYYNLALMSQKKGDIKEALKFCELILEFNKDDLHAKTLRSELMSRG